MLLTASKVYVRHPELAAAKANRDFVFRQVCEAVNTISDVAQGRSGIGSHPYDGPGELAAALDDFDVSGGMNDGFEGFLYLYIVLGAYNNGALGV